MNKILIILLITAVLNYTIRCIPILAFKGVQPGRHLKSFLEFVPYAALGALLFPEVLFSTGHIITAAIGGIFASILILKKQNMLTAVFGTIVVVYVLNMVI